MSTLTAAYISQMDNTTPAGGDQLNTVDDYLRRIAYILQNQFPNFTAAQVTATVAEINKLTGATITTAQLNTLLNNTENIKVALDATLRTNATRNISIVQRFEHNIPIEMRGNDAVFSSALKMFFNELQISDPARRTKIYGTDLQIPKLPTTSDTGQHSLGKFALEGMYIIPSTFYTDTGVDIYPGFGNAFTTAGAFTDVILGTNSIVQISLQSGSGGADGKRAGSPSTGWWGVFAVSEGIPNGLTKFGFSKFSIPTDLCALYGVNYTYFRRIGWVYCNSISPVMTILPFKRSADRYVWDLIQADQIVLAPSTTATNYTVTVPPGNGIIGHHIIRITSTATATAKILGLIRQTTDTFGTVDLTNSNIMANFNDTIQDADFQIDVPGYASQIRTKWTALSGSFTNRVYAVFTTGFTDKREYL